LRLAQPGLRCGACLRAPLPFERTCCAVDYAPPWDRLISAFKYQGRAELATVLAERLHAVLDEDALAWAQCIVPVPAAPARLRERGYNQAWELARRVAATARLPADPHALVRTSDSAPQASLSRAERQRNLAQAFAVRRPQVVAGRRVVLIDDVMTTGATAAVATRALLAAGAAAVQLWALARTP
jgi:ComF family protein